jgi:leucyl aminopeptidase (aminopeptidase T)
MELLAKHGPDGTRVAELGVGTNEKAILSDELLEAEKILGTVHVAFGASAGIGGTIQVPVHLDCVVMKPTLEIDRELVVREGELLV